MTPPLLSPKAAALPDARYLILGLINDSSRKPIISMVGQGREKVYKNAK